MRTAQERGRSRAPPGLIETFFDHSRTSVTENDFSTRSLEMHFKFAVLPLFHFIYNESLRIIFYEGVARCLE